MIQKRDIEKLRMKTVMSEAFNLIKTSPYQSIRENAATKLKFLQEEFKGAFGEYSEEHQIIEEGTIKYAEMPIGRLIDILMELKKKPGFDAMSSIQVNGTLLCKQDGNTVIMSNEPQM
jgi:hypothetical protein